MRTIIALLILAMTCSAASACEVGFEPWFRVPVQPGYDTGRGGNWGPAPIVSRCQPRYEWRQRVLRRYWVRLLCGRLELWEDVEHYRMVISR